jgi:hypothetical protein
MDWLDTRVWNLGSRLAPLAMGAALAGCGGGSIDDGGPTGPATSPDPTEGTPHDGIHCRTDEDCQGFSAYVVTCEDGICVDHWDYCNYYDSVACGDPECSSDLECENGMLCVDGSCTSPPLLPRCPDAPSFSASEIALPSAPLALAFTESDVPGERLIIAAGAGYVLALSPALATVYTIDLGDMVAASVDAGDLDGDGAHDVVIANGNGEIAAILRTPTPTIAPALFANAGRVALTDLDDDGLADAVVATGDGVVREYPAVGDGSWATPIDLGPGYTFAIGDLDGDPAPEAVLADGGLVRWDDGFAATIVDGFEADTVALARFEGGSVGSVVASAVSAPGTKLVHVRSSGAVVEVHAALSATIAGAGDFDGDDAADVLLGNAARLSIVRGGTDGLSCETVSMVPPVAAPTLVAAGDVDGDGRAEIVAVRDATLALARLE